MLDLLIRAATVLDGTGAPGRAADVGVAGDRIVLVGRAPEGVAAARTVDGAGLCLAPGFIDVHTHADHLPFVDPAMGAVLRQGVTTVVVGNCGDSLWPPVGSEGIGPYLDDQGPEYGRWPTFGAYLDAVDTARPAANVASLVGHGTVREQVLGAERRSADASALRAMSALVDEALADGAVGVSSGLIYQPGLFADVDELAAVARPLARRGSIYASHIRGEGVTVFSAVAEAIEVGRRSGAPVHVSHLKLAARSVWHRTDELLTLVHENGATCDQYPYTAGLTDLVSLLPPWATPDTFAALRTDAARLAHLEEVFSYGEPGWVGAGEQVDWERVVPVPVGGVDTGGLSLAALGREQGVAPLAVMLQMLTEDPGALVLLYDMAEEDVRTIMRDPRVMVASDSIPAPDDERWAGVRDHPRSYGTFPRVLGHYVRDEGVLSLESAVRKMTSLPADRFGLVGRGRVAEGGFADLTLFDAATVGGGGDFDRPHAAPQGVALVVVNGRVAWEGTSGERSGRVLRHAP